ncbi:MAG: anion transporter [Pseudanabaenaceae cyanobacterium]
MWYSWLIYAVLFCTYIGLALGRLPVLRMNRAAIALVSSAILIGLGAISLQSAWQAIDPNTIIFLLSMMIVNTSLSYGGAFPVILSYLVRITRSAFSLLCILTFGVGLLSAFLLNDTLALVATPLVIHITDALKLNPIPYLLSMAAATNIGSLATLSGNPQNILIASFSQISYQQFAWTMTPIAVIGLLLQILWLVILYPEVRSLSPFSHKPEIDATIFRPLFYKSIVITGCLFIAFIIGLPLAECSLVAASLLLVTRRLRTERFLSRVDWSLLVLFSGLFILTRVIQNLQVLEQFTPLIKAKIGLISLVTIASNLISNVPTVLLVQPLIRPEDTQAWLLLSASSTLAGNLTLFGAVANLITIESAQKAGHQLNFWVHLQFGLPLTVVTLGIAYWLL